MIRLESWCTGAKNDYFINVRLSLGRVLTTQFDWFGVHLVLNYVEFISDDQLTSVIVHYGFKRYNNTPNINAIRTYKCVYAMCLLTVTHHPWIKCCMRLTYKVHPTIYAFMGTNICSTSQQVYKWAYSELIWIVDDSACRRFGLSTFRFVDVPVVDVSVCRRFGLSTFWSVDVSGCRRFGLSTFWFVDVSLCRRFDQLPPSHYKKFQSNCNHFHKRKLLLCDFMSP